MATLIPSISTCAYRMTSGERHVAQRLEDKLDDDYPLWYDVPMGPKNAHPDFCVIALERDPQLVQPDGPHAGKLAFPWSYGAVFTNITRKQLEAAELQHIIEPHRVLCQDEMLESVSAEELPSRLWDKFPYMMRGVMSRPQLVAPTTNSLLLLYDDAQSIYGRARSKQFSFKSVGVQAHGRTTTLRINYRNTKQILQTANFIAADLLTADDKDNYGIPLGKLSSCGRENPAADAIQIMTMKFSKGLGFPGATQRLGT